jgi:hypothetical protein
MITAIKLLEGSLLLKKMAINVRNANEKISLFIVIAFIIQILQQNRSISLVDTDGMING